MTLTVSVNTQRTEKSAYPTAASVPVSTIFRSYMTNGRYSQSLFIRVKPTGFILNSSVISDVMTRGDVLVYNIESDCIHAMKGNTRVKVYKGHFVVTEEVEG